MPETNTFDTIISSHRRVTLPKGFKIGTLVRITVQELKAVPLEESN